MLYDADKNKYQKTETRVLFLHLLRSLPADGLELRRRIPRHSRTREYSKLQGSDRRKIRRLRHSLYRRKRKQNGRNRKTQKDKGLGQGRCVLRRLLRHRGHKLPQEPLSNRRGKKNGLRQRRGLAQAYRHHTRNAD